jgi:ApaG protein
MNEIEINVEPRYMAGQSDVYRDRYAFNYLITRMVFILFQSG